MTTVHVAIGQIIAEMEGIGKNQRNKDQNYNFRGIDDVLKVVHPLLGKYGVFFAPDVIEREYEERVSAKGTVGHCAHLHVRYQIFGPEGDSFELSTWGEGLDYSDKATNKAMTAAFKYALFEVFAIADPEDDGDHTTPGNDDPPQTVHREPPQTSQRPPQTRTFVPTGVTHLVVPFKDKDKAKGLGARWDMQAKDWYIPEGADPMPFVEWIPDDELDGSEPF
jgi:hypothetical protein